MHTVQLAYEQLISEGYIYSRERSGYFVSPFSAEWQEVMQASDVTYEQQPAPIRYNLNNGQVDDTAFPLKQWLKLYAEGA